MKRRKFIKNGLVGTIAAGMTPISLLTGRDCDLTNSDILGPYWIEAHPYRTILADPDEPGTRVYISGTVIENDCETPIQNAIVDVWHANDNGCYTLFMECDTGNPEEDPYNLRGQMLTNENGEYAFESIWPGYYGTRPKHFHYKITTPNGLELVTQCYFEGDQLINAQWEDEHSGQIIPLEETENGLVGVFDIIMDEETTQVGIYNEVPPVTEIPTLHDAYPNPFNSSTRIKFTNSRQGHISLEIYDISGKWVSRIVDGHFSSGTHSLIWKGIDTNGRPVPSGSYLVVMKHAGFTASKKIIYLK